MTKATAFLPGTTGASGTTVAARAEGDLDAEQHEPHDQVYDVVGSLCENNDKFAIDRKLPKIAERGLTKAMPAIRLHWTRPH